MAMIQPAPASFPAALLGVNRSDVRNQRKFWRPTPFWREALSRHPALMDALIDEVITHQRIRRIFVHEQAHGDPVELFLAVMAWGFGTYVPRFPAQKALLVGPNAA